MIKDKKIVLFDIDYTVFNTDILKQSDLKTFKVYDEVHEVLNKLKEIADLGIFSQGDVAFQHKKLVETNIVDYFHRDHIHIVPEKFSEIADLIKAYHDHGRLYLVDDRLPILQAAKQENPAVRTIWVKRGFFAENQDPIPNFEPDATVLTLKEIVSLIAQE